MYAWDKKQSRAVSNFRLISQEPLAMKELNRASGYVTPKIITQLNISAQTVDGYIEHDEIGELNFD